MKRSQKSPSFSLLTLFRITFLILHYIKIGKSQKEILVSLIKSLNTQRVFIIFYLTH